MDGSFQFVSRHIPVSTLGFKLHRTNCQRTTSPHCVLSILHWSLPIQSCRQKPNLINVFSKRPFYLPKIITVAITIHTLFPTLKLPLPQSSISKIGYPFLPRSQNGRGLVADLKYAVICFTIIHAIFLGFLLITVIRLLITMNPDLVEGRKACGLHHLVR
jgi:hypothetical protein